MSKLLFRPKKHLGQNFLRDSVILDVIVGSINEISSGIIIEIGAGLGSLTERMLKYGANKVIAIEKDTRCIEHLSELANRYPDRLIIINDDVLYIDFRKLASQPCKIVANLPYNISSQILFKIFDDIGLYQQIILMFQKELANRITAIPDNKSYSRISVISQLLADVTRVTDVPARCFEPVPKVDSTILEFIPKAQLYSQEDYQHILRVTKSLFAQKRKTLFNNMKYICSDPEYILCKLGINGNLRAENLTIQQFLSIADSIDKITSDKSRK